VRPPEYFGVSRKYDYVLKNVPGRKTHVKTAGGLNIWTQSVFCGTRLISVHKRCYGDARQCFQSWKS
jgi:hypothetical protein